MPMLQSAQAAKMASTQIAIIVASARNCAASTAPRPGRWVRIVFSVPQVYSPPITIAPSTRASAPAKIG